MTMIYICACESCGATVNRNGSAYCAFCVEHEHDKAISMRTPYGRLHDIALRLIGEMHAHGRGLAAREYQRELTALDEEVGYGRTPKSCATSQPSPTATRGSRS